MDWLLELDKTTQGFMKEFGELTNEQLNWKPDADTWSIAQNIDHLITINSSYYPSLDELKEGKYRIPILGKFRFLAKWIGRMILKSVDPENTKKNSTLPLWQPQQGDLKDDILERFVMHQSRLKKEMDACKDLIIQDAIISSPANRNIVYTLKQAFDLIVVHEKRHFLQAKRIMDILPSIT